MRLDTLFAAGLLLRLRILLGATWGFWATRLLLLRRN